MSTAEACPTTATCIKSKRVYLYIAAYGKPPSSTLLKDILASSDALKKVLVVAIVGSLDEAGPRVQKWVDALSTTLTPTPSPTIPLHATLCYLEGVQDNADAWVQKEANAIWSAMERCIQQVLDEEDAEQHVIICCKGGVNRSCILGSLLHHYFSKVCFSTLKFYNGGGFGGGYDTLQAITKKFTEEISIDSWSSATLFSVIKSAQNACRRPRRQKEEVSPRVLSSAPPSKKIRGLATTDLVNTEYNLLIVYDGSARLVKDMKRHVPACMFEQMRKNLEKTGQRVYDGIVLSLGINSLYSLCLEEDPSYVDMDTAEASSSKGYFDMAEEVTKSLLQLCLDDRFLFEMPSSERIDFIISLAD